MPLKTAREVLLAEARAIRDLVGKLDGNFKRAVHLIKNVRGRVILLGMGKPGIIAQKISASLASTGTPSMAFHPSEAAHGDLGRIHKNDILILLSKSGQTAEIVAILPALKRMGCRLIAITGNPQSALAKTCDVTLDVSVKKEAGPLGVAPTSSTVCMLAMGDALTMALVKAKKFRTQDFAALHPGGTLGKTLSLKVKNVMRTGASSPAVGPGTPIKKTLLKITSAKAGAVSVVDRTGRLVGIFTDGDLRRSFRRIMADLDRPVSDYMTRRPLTVREDQLAAEALEVMKKRRIDELPVVNGRGRLAGLLDVQDLLREGLA